MLSSCSDSKDEALNFDLTGIWQDGEQIILIQNSTMINPFWDSYGFFFYSIKNDTLIIEDSDLQSVGKIDFFDLNNLHLIAINQDNDTLKFKRVSKGNPKKFNSLIFEAGIDEGRLPVFRMEIDESGRVTYEGELYSEMIGKHEIQLDTLSINQLHQLFEIIEIWDYPEKELLPLPGTGEMNLTIRYPEGDVVEIKNGLFEGKYFILQKIFKRFESLLLKKKAHNITLDPAGVSE